METGGRRGVGVGVGRVVVKEGNPFNRAVSSISHRDFSSTRKDV